MAEFRLLGPVEVHVAGHAMDLGPAKQRGVLAALVFDAGQVIPSDVLIDRVWGDSPPSRVHGVLYTHISRIRRLLAAALADDAAPISRRSGGYVFEAAPESVDVHRFRRLVADATAINDAPIAAAAYRHALGEWRGSFCADLCGVWFDLIRAELDGERLAALANRFDVELLLGRHADVLPELRVLSAADLFDERLAGQVMLAAYRSGRQSEALDCYEKVRRELATEIAVEPGAALQTLHQQMLHRDPALAGPAHIPDTAAPRPAGGPAAPAAPPRGSAVVDVQPAPAQLPHDVAAFAGRDRELAQLNRLVPDEDVTSAQTAVVICAITGTAGVGKTALAVRWAHQVGHRFPDGHLFVNLHGYASTAPMRPIEALAGFLRAFGVPAEQVPVEEQQAAAMFRSVLAGRRVLVVLDNAHNAEQVRPLLPGSAGCLALVTSRDRFGGLVARDGAHRLTLDVLPADEAREVLAGVLGRERVDAEPAASAELIDLCARLPMALRIAAATLADTPWRAIAAYVTELAAGNRLAALEVGGDDASAVRAAFDLSYAGLPAPAQRLFRRLALVPGADFTAEATAVLAETATAQAARLLNRLAGEHLLEQRASGRYTFHDLLRAYAAERVQAEDCPPERDAATRRLYDWYLHSADSAARLLYPQKLRLPVPVDDDQPRPSFDDHVGALAWVDAERRNLVVAVQQAAQHGPHHAAWLITDTLRSYFWRCRHVVDWLVAAQAGLAAAEADGEQRAEAAMHFGLGDAYRCRGQYTQAIHHHSKARALMQCANWPQGEAATLTNLGTVFREAGQLTCAADHYQQALKINEKYRRWHGLAITHAHLGLVCHELGQLQRAVEHLTTGLEIQRRTMTRLEIPVDLGLLAATYHALGRFDDAVEHLSEALRVHRELGCRAAEAANLRILAEVHRDRCGREPAAETVRMALSLARETGDRREEADALNTLASIHQRFGEPDQATEHNREALRLAREIDARYTEVVALVGLAGAHSAASRPEAARAPAHQALTQARRAGYRALEGHAHTVLAEVNLTRDRIDHAIRHAGRALAIQQETGHRLGQAEAALVLGHAVQRTGQASVGQKYWQQALELFASAGALEADRVRSLLKSALVHRRSQRD